MMLETQISSGLVASAPCSSRVERKYIVKHRTFDPGSVKLFNVKGTTKITPHHMHQMRKAAGLRRPVELLIYS